MFLPQSPRPCRGPTTSSPPGQALQTAQPPDRVAEGPGPVTQQAGDQTSPLLHLRQPGSCLQGCHWHLSHSGGLWALSSAFHPARPLPGAPCRVLAGDGWTPSTCSPPVLPGFLKLPCPEPLVLVVGGCMGLAWSERLCFQRPSVMDGSSLASCSALGAQGRGRVCEGVTH